MIDLDGDLSSLVDGDTTTLTLNTRPINGSGYSYRRESYGRYRPASRNDDYELTPITINRITGEATFEIRIVDDSDFDPLEGIELEVISSSDDVRIVATNSLKLKIYNNDPKPPYFVRHYAHDRPG